MRICCIFFSCFFAVLSFSIAQVSIVTLENQVYEGKILGINNESIPFLTLQTKKEIKKLFCQDIVQVLYQKPEKKNLQKVCLVLCDGSQIFGEVSSGDQKSLGLNSPSFGEILIDLTKIREIRMGEVEELSETDDMESDILYFKTGDVLKCLIENFGPGYVQVQHPQLGTRKEYFDKLERIVFAQLEAPQEFKKDTLAVVRGVDHSLLYGKITKITENSLTLYVFPLDQEVNILNSKIQHFSFLGGRFVYLSDLSPQDCQMKYIPYFPGPVEPFLPKRDKNQRGEEISLNGQSFFKGIGVLSRTEITVKLDQKYRKFQSHIGIDDQIREIYKFHPYSIGGSVVFQIYLDGRKNWDSGIVYWFDPPKSIDLDIQGYKEMVLIVDFAENAHVNDLANWAGARLIR